MSGVILTTISLVAYQVKTLFGMDLGKQSDEVLPRHFHDIETADDLSYRWSHVRSRIFARFTPTLPSGESKETEEVSL